MRAFFREKNAIKRDEIAGRQMHALHELHRASEKPVRIPDIKLIFEEMKDRGGDTR